MIKIYIVLITLTLLLACKNSVIKEVPKFQTKGVSSEGLYPNLDDIYIRMNELNQKYPNNIRLFEIGRSYKYNKSIPLLRLSGGTTGSSRQFLFVAGTHGDEAAAVSAIIYSIEKIFADGMIDDLKNKNIIIDFIPVHNPDGYSENERENGAGKDINRNFPVGYTINRTEPETASLMRLIEQRNYTASLFFHTANEKKYENLLRVPVEYKRLGDKALENNFAARLRRLTELVIDAGNEGTPSVQWRSASDMVNAAGISSDWCVSGYINKQYKDIVESACSKSHPSLIVELCYPKQPLSEDKLMTEKKETFSIIKKVILNY